MNVTAVDGVWSIITASLTNGASVQAQFGGGTPPLLASITPQLSLAAGATFTWTVEAIVLNNGLPMAGAGGGMADRGHGIHWPGQHRSHHHNQRRRHAPANRRPARRGPDGHHQCLPQRHQPVRGLHRIWRAAGVRRSRSRLWHQPERCGCRYAQPDCSSPARYGWQPHGRRLRDSLSSPLRVGAALRNTRSLPALKPARQRSRNSNLRNRRQRCFYGCLAARRGHQPPWFGRLRQYGYRQHCRSNSIRSSPGRTPKKQPQAFGLRLANRTASRHPAHLVRRDGRMDRGAPRWLCRVSRAL